MKEIKKAQWKVSWNDYYLFCSNCNYEPHFEEVPEFCPNCGADMKDEYYYKLINSKKGVNK